MSQQSSQSENKIIFNLEPMATYWKLQKDRKIVVTVFHSKQWTMHLTAMASLHSVSDTTAEEKAC